MSDKNWRNANKRGLSGRKQNWRNRNATEENAYSVTSPGFPREGPERQHSRQHSRTTQQHFRTHSQRNMPREKISPNLLRSSEFLNDLTENQDVEQITSFLILNVEEFSKILASDLSEDIFIALLKLTGKACENSFISTKSNMLKSTMQQKFVSTVCSFLSGLIVTEKAEPVFWKNVEIVLGNLLVLLESCMQLIPLTSWEHVQTVVKSLTLILPVLHENNRIHLPDNFTSRVRNLKDDLAAIEKKFNKPATVGVLAERPVEDYRYMDVYPTTEELVIAEKAFVRKNIVKGAFPSVHDYLDIHFRLLREDFLNPIRGDLCDYTSNTKRHLFNIKIHKNACFLIRNAVRNLICYEVKFEPSKGLTEVMQSRAHKRFMYGTLLLFSDDKFKTLFCGKVVGNDNLKEGIIHVDLPNHVPTSYPKTYTMIECIVFFEPYYQVLSVFKRLSTQNLPMEKYILNVERNISHPKYMESIRDYELPKGLNPSQATALDAALNKEFVIIQGPPGTGKTFLGMTLVKMMLNFKQHWEGPILIITFTNHALEQFLDGLRASTDKIVRLGRNSDDLRNAHSKYGPKTQLRNRPSGSASDIHRNLLLRRWLRSKDDLKEHFKQLKEMEREIETVKTELSRVTTMTGQGIFLGFVLENTHSRRINIARENIAEYYFQVIELLGWLLCDDGTVPWKQGDSGNNSIRNRTEEENKVFYLLSNFVFGRDSKTYFRETNGYVSLSTLYMKAEKLSNLINNQDLRGKSRRFFQEQIDFFMEKIRYLKHCLDIDFGAPDINTNDVPNPFMIPLRNRWQLYKSWIQIYRNNLEEQLEQCFASYQTAYNRYNDLTEMNNVKLLKYMDIVGMTTTCAARMRSTLEALGCPIVIVEEAAEVLESHIVAALTHRCQHLILLGDHQQLRPKTSDFTMDKKYKLGISMFERMVQNNVDCHTLNVQHRMRPEISNLISPLFYKELFNHESVEDYPSVAGVRYPMYFIDHTEPEEPYGDSSKMNTHEAKFLIQFAIYLIRNSYTPEDITILTTYLGQMYELKKEQQKAFDQAVKKVRIAVVDNFQGEENKIILLSLVRNNSERKIGFLSIDNRVCVALSRAKHGFYIMGNMDHLCDTTEIWKSVKATLKSHDAISTYLPLRCKNHENHVTLVSKDTDFLKVPEGGCNQRCNTLLNCGHYCVKICHGYDTKHELYECKEKCTRSLCSNEAHICKNACFYECGSCDYPVQRTLLCGHEKMLACATVYETYECEESKQIQPECGHIQNIPCIMDISQFKCKVMVKQPMPKCEHVRIVPCHKIEVIDKNFVCKESKEIQRECGHIQHIPCFRDISKCPCHMMVERTMPECQHLQSMPCTQDISKFKCQFKVEVTLNCGHKQKKLCSSKDENVTVKYPLFSGLLYRAKYKYFCREPCSKNRLNCSDPNLHGKCPLLCYEACQPCKEMILHFYTNCSHFEMVECFAAKEPKKCQKPCSKSLPCGHLCPNKCSDPCNKCDKYSMKPIAACGHKIKIECGKTPTQYDCDKPCLKRLNCNHVCQNVCNRPCTEKCQKQCQKVLDCDHKCIKKCHQKCACKTELIQECGHTIAARCGEEISQKNCEKMCRKILPCGHPYHEMVKCNTPISDMKCLFQRQISLPCGHSVYDFCSTPPNSVVCINMCEKLLECGHPCQALCNQPCTSSVVCSFPCDKLLKCKHRCQNKCHQPCTLNCSQNCQEILACGHKCNQICGMKCSETCTATCGKKLVCDHQCNKPCGAPCTDICDRPCTKALPCGHTCKKMCREECDINCKEICDKLLPCGHKCEQQCAEPCTKQCLQPCSKLLKCGHSCQAICFYPCISAEDCDRVCGKMLPCKHARCTNLCNEPCIRCNKKCKRTLSCGHACINLCGERCACAIVKSTDCSHFVRAKCRETPSKQYCS